MSSGSEAAARRTTRSAAATEAISPLSATPRATPLHLHPVQPGLGSYERAQRPEVQPHLQVVLHQHAFGERGNSEAHCLVGRAVGGDVAAQSHPTREALHAHGLEDRVGGQKGAQFPDVRQNSQIALDQYVFRERGRCKPKRAISCRCRPDLAAEGYARATRRTRMLRNSGSLAIRARNGAMFSPTSRLL